MDDAVVVKRWLGSGQLRRPSEDEAACWARAQGLSFRFLIVQPFVLVVAPPA